MDLSGGFLNKCQKIEIKSPWKVDTSNPREPQEVEQVGCEPYLAHRRAEGRPDA